jgi:hypothetical protein
LSDGYSSCSCSYKRKAPQHHSTRAPHRHSIHHPIRRRNSLLVSIAAQFKHRVTGTTEGRYYGTVRQVAKRQRRASERALLTTVWGRSVRSSPRSSLRPQPEELRFPSATEASKQTCITRTRWPAGIKPVQTFALSSVIRHLAAPVPLPLPSRVAAAAATGLTRTPLSPPPTHPYSERFFYEYQAVQSPPCRAEGKDQGRGRATGVAAAIRTGTDDTSLLPQHNEVVVAHISHPRPPFSLLTSSFSHSRINHSI